jgi:hypothetical protein
LICIVVGYAASWLFPAPQQVAGLTIYESQTAAAPVAAERLQPVD